ncbi:response regulator transcription factor [Helicobacter fennelliae]|uniref:Two-component system response regulator n=1 Tax=Helicobacter fennelliae TaxID=215 RepID=A0A2X3BSX6_9HELI|nr:response regulator transcription factor [Helicobacter fennelliae]SQB99295.1 two-component system response regulator [Helicobacter fennelliae]STQ84900.1 two-component system response regulator [Helicobacter fennelliae]
MPTKILLLEDDLCLCEMIEDHLRDCGFEIITCDDATNALDLAYEKNFDLWIFDVKVPNGNGFTLLKQLRELNKTTPAIFLTSLSMINDLKEGFMAGCDDYIKKPFDIDELTLRIRSLLKRQFSHHNSEILDLGNNLSFDMIQKQLYKDNQPILLTNKESKLLALLLRNQGKFISQDEIFETIWNYDEMPTNMALRVYIKNLRKVLGKDSILTQRHRGYCYAKTS